MFADYHERMEQSPIMNFTDAAAWEAWLAEHSDQSDAWLLIAKKSSGKPTISIEGALDVALCYGWIDSHRKAYDQYYFLQRYSPRGAKSPWSWISRQKVEALIAAGRMQPTGMAAIHRAQANGRWPTT